ncbi:TIGR03086 family metal-binding protein [Nocardia alni]|uniref:TIGR03086 family metal-binding protein n=1 Tax=Nocardia alni TaxID=2815723 RepID=UPI001C227BAF|nr:TIGR03086 family metal-binding protein [Nocardia alni]
MLPLESYDRAIDLATGVIASISDDQLSCPTPCSEWTVRDILNHFRLATLLMTAAIHGTPPPDRGKDHLGDNPRGTAVESLLACRALVNEPGMIDKPATGPMGPITVTWFVERSTADLTAHTWDLSRAIDRPTDYDPELNEFVLAHYRARLDGKDRTGLPLAAEREPHADATAADRLAAYLGRDPDFTLTS